MTKTSDRFEVLQPISSLSAKDDGRPKNKRNPIPSGAISLISVPNFSVRSIQTSKTLRSDRAASWGSGSPGALIVDKIRPFLLLAIIVRRRSHPLVQIAAWRLADQFSKRGYETAGTFIAEIHRNSLNRLAGA